MKSKNYILFPIFFGLWFIFVGASKPDQYKKVKKNLSDNGIRLVCPKADLNLSQFVDTDELSEIQNSDPSFVSST